MLFTVFCYLAAISSSFTLANPHAKRLFEDLLADYNRLVRPVNKNGDTLQVMFKLKLSQLLDVRWKDYKLQWDPRDYGGVGVLYVPSEMIWLPDIVLYNNADGNYQVTIMTKAKVYSNGTVVWNPPAIYKSMCQINVEWFPFDAQECEMKFGSWTYGGLEVDLKHKDQHLQKEEKESRNAGGNSSEGETIWVVEEGIDLEEYYASVEWEIMSVPGVRHKKIYPCCDSPFIDITYYINLRRKTLFYTVNLIFPSVGISFLTALVFYLPSDSGEKISLCISILISLTVFFLLLVEIIPSTSLVIPLIGKYLLFTMVLVTLSVVVTVMTLNVHYRSPTTHTMPYWIRRLFIELLPRFLCIQRPSGDEEEDLEKFVYSGGPRYSMMQKVRSPDVEGFFSNDPLLSNNTNANFRSAFDSHQETPQRWRPEAKRRDHSPLQTAVDSVAYIADHLRGSEDDDAVIEDWKYVAMVLDRLFLWIFTMCCALGTFTIVLRAPTLYDTRTPIA